VRARAAGAAPRQLAREELLREHFDMLAALLAAAAGPGGPDTIRLQRTLIARRGDRLVDAGLLTQEEIGQHLADLTAGGLDLAAFPVVSAWGRKSLKAGRGTRRAGDPVGPRWVRPAIGPGRR
jgi:hypothetical protein